MANELSTGLQSILRAPTNLASGKLSKFLSTRLQLILFLDISGMTTTEAAQYALVFAEIYCWFIVGECIGKGGIVGYWV